MSYTASLSGCQAKLNRAKAHRMQIALQIEQYFSVTSNRPTLLAELDPNDGTHVFRIASVTQVVELQEILAVMIGDCVHNIRSALDHLAYQLALVNTNDMVRYPRKVQFPIETTAQSYAKDEGSRLAEVRNDHRSIIESYQPYHGSAGRPDDWSGPYIHQLELLNYLSNQDKHRLLNPVLLIPNQAEISLPNGVSPDWPQMLSPSDFERLNPFRNAGEKLEIGVEFCRRKLLGTNIPTTISNAGYVIPQITLDEKRPVGPTLERLEKYVELILNDFRVRLVSP